MEEGTEGGGGDQLRNVKIRFLYLNITLSL